MIDEIRERVGAALSKRRGIEFDADELRTLVQVGFETWLISASQAEAALAKEARRPLDNSAYSPATLAERWAFRSDRSTGRSKPASCPHSISARRSTAFAMMTWNATKMGTDTAVAKFDRQVATGAFPLPFRLGRYEYWSRTAIDETVVVLTGEGGA